MLYPNPKKPETDSTSESGRKSSGTVSTVSKNSSSTLSVFVLVRRFRDLLAATFFSHGTILLLSWMLSYENIRMAVLSRNCFIPAASTEGLVIHLNGGKIEVSYPGRSSEKTRCEVQCEGRECVMITVNIYYTGTNGNAGKFAEEMEKSGTADLIRAEKGNVRYEYFCPMNDPETVLLIDSWESQEAIDAHHASPMMKTITGLREKYDLHMKVERFVSDDMPSDDEGFIRK